MLSSRDYLTVSSGSPAVCSNEGELWRLGEEAAGRFFTRVYMAGDKSWTWLSYQRLKLSEWHTDSRERERERGDSSSMHLFQQPACAILQQITWKNPGNQKKTVFTPKWGVCVLDYLSGNKDYIPWTSKLSCFLSSHIDCEINNVNTHTVNETCCFNAKLWCKEQPYIFL